MAKVEVEKRLEILKTAEEIGLAKAAELYNISQRTITNWKKRMKESGEEGLKNRSKKNQKHPNKMPQEDLDNIILISQEEPELSLQQIKDKLNLPYTLSTIHKKINAYGKKKSTKDEISDKFFKGFYIYIKQISPLKDSNLPKYQITIRERKTGASFIAFSYEKNNHAIFLFLDYFINNMKEFNISLTGVKFYASKSLINQNPYIKNNILKNYPVKFVELESGFKSNFKNGSAFELLKQELYREEDIVSDKDLSVRALSFMLYYNCRIMKESMDEIKPKSLLPSVKKLMYYCAPILIDDYLGVICGEKSWKLTDDELIEKAILNLEKVADDANNSFNNGKALDIYNNLILSLQLREDICMEIRVLANQCQIYDRIGEWDRVEYLLTKTLKLAEQEEFSCQIIKVNSLLGNYFLKTGRPDKAISYIRKQLNVADKIECEESILSARLNLGKVYLYTGDLDLALAEYELIVKHDCEKTKEMTIEALGKMGNIFSTKGEFKIAENLYKRSYNLALKHGKGEKNSWIFSLMGKNYLNKKDFDNSILYFNKAIAIEEKKGDRYDLMKYINNLGNVYYNMEKYDKALEYLRESLAISESLGDIYTKSISYGNVADVYISLNRYKIATKYIKTAIELAKKMKNKFLICHYYGIQAKLCQSQKDYQCAINFCSKGIELANEIGAKNDLMELQQIYKKIPNPD